MAGFRTAEDAKQFAIGCFCHFIIIAAFLTIRVRLYLVSISKKIYIYGLRDVPFVLPGATDVFFDNELQIV